MTLQLTAPQQANGTISLPTSKSISNRALMIAALCGGDPQVLHPALCDDTAVMVNALARQEGDINVGAAGTAMRFLTAYFATREGVTVTLDGVERMRHRPIGPLVDVLRFLGAHIKYLGQEGFPPLQITGTTMHGGDITMAGDVSSQFISAVMMILPAIGGGSIQLTGNIVSAPYIHMTAAVMRKDRSSRHISTAHEGTRSGVAAMSAKLEQQQSMKRLVSSVTPWASKRDAMPKRLPRSTRRASPWILSAVNPWRVMLDCGSRAARAYHGAAALQSASTTMSLPL